MTTEVSVMNRHAVALAADSAGTVRITEKGKKTEKIFFSENKLFALSKYHPVGIMVYGSADFMTVPLEIIIKEYRRFLGKKEFNTLKEYALDFISYLKKQKKLSSAEIQQIIYIHSIRDFLKEINELMQEGQKDNKKFSPNGLINEIYKSFNKLKNLPNLPRNKAEEISIKYKLLTKKFIESIVSTKLSITSINKLIKICALILTKDSDFPLDYSGIVIAGYGKNESYPSVESYKLYGVFDNYLKVIREDAKSDAITYDNNVSIMAFAQGDVVSTFMEGLDPKFRETLLGNIQDLMKETVDNVSSKLSKLSEKEREKITKELTEHSTKMMEELGKKIFAYQAKYHVNPIVNNIRFLAKDALAEMAETLVNITSFKKKSSMVPETVGGPVDVAVISKGDGFIWIKRKHYFDQKFNHQFFENYYQQ